MERIAWKRLSDQWPVIFCLAVAAWFAISAAGVPEKVSSIVPASNDTNTAEPAPVNVSNDLQVGVESFYLERTSSGLEAKLTLEVVNESSSNSDFRPGSLKLVRPGGATHGASDLRAEVVQVAPTVPVLTTVTFPVDPSVGGLWRIEYGERVVYEGVPR